MSSAGGGWPRWLLATLLVLAVLVLIPLGWMTCSMLFGGGMMAGGGMMGGDGMMGMHWPGLLAMAVLLVLLVALILLLVRALFGGRTAESPQAGRRSPPRTPPGPHDASPLHDDHTGSTRKETP